MNAKLNFASPSSTLTVAAAALASVIAMGILWAVRSEERRVGKEC